MGFPLIGDKVYGAKVQHGRDIVPALTQFPRQALHAATLAIDHVRTGKRIEFHAPLPNDMAQLVDHLRQLSVGSKMLSGKMFFTGVDKERALK
jgi:23S rRNA pseudouridine1911/1915/1917 synthase